MGTSSGYKWFGNRWEPVGTGQNFSCKSIASTALSSYRNSRE